MAGTTANVIRKVGTGHRDMLAMIALNNDVTLAAACAERCIWEGADFLVELVDRRSTAQTLYKIADHLVGDVIPPVTNYFMAPSAPAAPAPPPAPPPHPNYDPPPAPEAPAEPTPLEAPPEHAPEPASKPPTIHRWRPSGDFVALLIVLGFAALAYSASWLASR